MLDEAKQDISKLKGVLENVGDALDLDGLRAKEEELKTLQAEENFWSDLSKAQEVNKHLKVIENKLNRYNALKGRVEDV